MMSFRGGRLREEKLSSATVWLLTEIAEAKGRQDLYRKQSPQMLAALREMALIQSTESSNRIEGVTVDPKRLAPLVLGNIRPRDRSEEEIQGYRRVLHEIHGGAANLPVAPDTMRRMHRTIQEGAGDSGRWKRVNNEITEVRPGRAPILRFRPVEVRRTPRAVAELCRSYRHAIDQEKIPLLVASACLVLDFLCIHPFRDGNGRVSRLLSLLTLYHQGIEVGRYISLERLVEETKSDYYEVLRQSSAGWHEGKHDIVPWLNYHLAIVRRAFFAFEERAARTPIPRGAKTSLVQAAIRSFAGDFRLGDLERACPGVSRDLVRVVLRNMKRQGSVRCVGRGPGARWKQS